MKISKRDALMWMEFFASLPEDEALLPRQQEIALAVLSQIEAAADARAEALRRTYPPASDERVAADTARAMALVLTGAKSLAEGSTVVGTEVGFGGGHGDLVVTVGKYALHVNGSIDRIDRLADGSLAIVDYKTGDIGKYRDHPERYVQPLLYTLAAEALLGEPGAVRRASYLSLRDGSVLERDMSAGPRAQAAAQLEAFLDLLCANA